MKNMSMRSQVYEWANLSTSGNFMLRRGLNATAVAVPVDREISVFTGQYGNNITKPAETTATQFVVIEDLATSAYVGGAVQVVINTTSYFQNPDVTQQAGVPGTASPYPRGSSDTVTTANTDNGVQLLNAFELTPDVYVLPGQVWDMRYSQSLSNDSAVNTTLGVTGSTLAVAAFVKYTLYDGPDALIANKLLELGVTVNPNNVDWYKRTLIEQQSAAASAAAVAAANGGGQ
jgi:hypothetical protein